MPVLMASSLRPLGTSMSAVRAEPPMARRALEEILAAHGLGLEQDARPRQGEALGQLQDLGDIGIVRDHELPPGVLGEKAAYGRGLDASGFGDAGAAELDRDIPLDGAADARRRQDAGSLDLDGKAALTEAAQQGHEEG